MTTIAPRHTCVEPTLAPAIVHFGRVRVHTDERAAESAAAVGAEAYTVGRHVVFGAGRYAAGERGASPLLAHEFTHVLQSGAGDAVGPIALGSRGGPHEREADAGGRRGEPAHRDGGSILRRQSRQRSGTTPGGLDARATAIVTAAAGSGPEADRAIQAVRSIIATYFAADAGLVSGVVFDAAEVGLSTSSATGPRAAA